MRAWSGSGRSKGLAVGVVLLVAAALLGLLASGVLSRATGGSQSVVPTVLPTVATTSESESTGARPTTFAPGDWGTYGGSFDEIRHSPLTQIGKQNVAQLGRVFTVDFRKLDPTIPKGQQSFPIVIGGVIYVTTGNGHVFAVDGGSGRVLWRFTPSGTGIFSNYGVNANRGVAYCDGRVFLLTLDMRLIALDARTGKLVRQVAISDAVPGARVEFGYSETQAPICYDNEVIFGASGSDYGVRGFVMAYTTNLAPAWPSPYWIIPPAGSEWRRQTRAAGGGTNWNPVAIDPQTNTLYATTSNPSPIFAPQLRPGPDPRTDSIVALDVSNGRQRWWQQQIAGDQWGYSTTQPPLVYDVKIGGTQHRVVSVATKEGTWFMYDAHTGAPIYSRVKLLYHVEHSALRPGKPVAVYPSSLGGINYSPSSFDPGAGYVINNQAETGSVLTEKLRPAAVEVRKVLGDVDNGLANGSFGDVPQGWKDYGSVSAVDAATGQLAWKFVTPEPGRGGVTTTAAGIGFAGGGDGILRAFDDLTGNVLWAFQTGYQLASGPTVYQDHGKEYVALTVGGTATSSFGGTASQLQVFALNGSTSQSPAPALRPAGAAPGLIGAPQAYLSLGADAHTLALQLVVGPDSTIDASKDGALRLQLPAGWRVNVTVANQSPSVATRVSVVGLTPGATPSLTAPVAFAGASTGDIAPGSNAYFHFTTSGSGDYAIAGRAPGAWARLRITPANALPELTVGGQTFAVDVAAHHG